MSDFNLIEMWPFADDQSVAVYTTQQVIHEGQAILHVSHDGDDGSWQFHTGMATVSVEDAVVLSLEEIVQHDDSLLELADLPCGWIAERDDENSPWIRMMESE